ncbi:cation transporter, putative [Leishmania donovani]|uniref:Cation transporter, putative n=1 Tax=Leishmania donovani TaxID=5661 RepID=E9BPS2_LEIDO|nr:cation transporter, putative [Leishmania donovani]TPP42945.1 ZIP Zinc transporter family protein [Leishmania donovani]CBZ37476.1 cation transporter, putative [Leishmania donovani]
MTHNGTPWPPSCEATENENYSSAWHVVALFVILGCSLLGTVLPILGKRVSAFRVPEYAYAIGKSVATGVVLGVALIHMLKPANESLTSDCMPSALRNFSKPLAYIICIASVAAMHSLEACLRVFFDGYGAVRDLPIASGESQHLLSGSQAGGHHFHPSAPAFDSWKSSGGLQILSAVLLEFGVSLHSLFVGLTVGMCADAELYTLMCALSFHQFFEGVALGSRLVDAALTLRTEYVLAAVFVLSAPLGTAVGIMCVCEHIINTKGSMYLLTQGILDSVCAGILLYIGFQLLVGDFYADMQSTVHNVRSPRGFLLAMLVALWAGVSIMALIGQYV